MMQGIAENTEIDVDEIDTLSFLSFLPRRERPLLAGNFDLSMVREHSLYTEDHSKEINSRHVELAFVFAKCNF